MATRTVGLDKGVIDQVEQIKPEYMSLSAFCTFILDQHVKGQVANLTLPPLQSPQQHTISESKGLERERKGLAESETNSHKGKERERKGKGNSLKKSDFLLLLPKELTWAFEQISEYWTQKKGSKTEQAAKLLFTELSKIEDAYSQADVITQLALATANQWQGITAANFERFRHIPATSAQALEIPKSNAGAYHDFTADRIEREKAEKEASCVQS